MHRSPFLHELYELEGREEDATCLCGQPAFWRCMDCTGFPRRCAICLRDSHQLIPLHRVEAWTGTHYAPAWLRTVGVRIALGHGGKGCPTDDAFSTEYMDQTRWKDAKKVMMLC